MKSAVFFFLLIVHQFSSGQEKHLTIKSDTNQIAQLIKQGDVVTSVAKEKPEKALSYYQKALALSKQLQNISFVNTSLLKLSVQYAKMGDLRQCRNSYQQVLNYYRNRNDLLNIGKTLDFLYDEFYEISTINAKVYEEKIYCLEQKRANHFKLKDTIAAITDLKNIGDAHLNEGKLDLAEDELLNVLSSFKAIHFKTLYHTYFLLGAVSHLKGDLHKELYYNIEMVRGMVAANDTSFGPLFYYKLARTYKDLGIYDKSLIYFHKAINSSKAKNLDFEAAVFQIIEVMVADKRPAEALAYLKKEENLLPVDAPDRKYFLNLEFADCYIALKQNQKAEYYLMKMIENQLAFYKTESVTAELHLRDFKQVSEFYMSIKNYTKAKYYLDKGTALPKNNVSALSLSQLELLNFRVDSAFGKYVSAIKHFQNHKRLTDSIFNATKSKQIADLQIHYEVVQKDKNILLLEKQAIIEKERVEQKRVVANMLVAGVVLLLALLGLLYSRYRLKQRSIISLKKIQKEVSGKNQTLQQLLQDNEWLLKEVHHRIKNNLQIVTSLLNSQSAYMDEGAALDAIMKSKGRVESIALIHQKLYKSESQSNIYMPEYIQELVGYLKDSFVDDQDVWFDVCIEEINLDVSDAVPVGLIINESVTNSIKHAFKKGNTGNIIQIVLKKNDSNLELLIRDSGKGFIVNKSKENSSFGLLLINGLSKDLGGKLSMYNDGGTVVQVSFKPLSIKGTENAPREVRKVN